jgi:hypothetical protein
LWPGGVHQCRNPVGVVIFSRRLTQGGSFLATLGFETESLWDSWTARLALQETEMRTRRFQNLHASSIRQSKLVVTAKRTQNNIAWLRQA